MRAASAVYPVHNCLGFALNFSKALRVACDAKGEFDWDEDETTWAFCFRTSAGVRMRQETSSATQEEKEGRRGGGISRGESRGKRTLVDS